MAWRPDKSLPICPQICERFCVLIATGEYAPEARLPSVREVAMTAGVNPNTVQKAMETLEAQGLIYSVRGSGWYVGKDAAPARETLDRLRRRRSRAYLDEMERLGCTREDISRILEEERDNG